MAPKAESFLNPARLLFIGRGYRNAYRGQFDRSNDVATIAEKIVITPDRFMVFRDDHTVSVTADAKKADRIARHFKRLQPQSKVAVQDKMTNERKEV
jgi:hypothetical protein